ncbi:MAG: helix-turn-helix transcriptional regulator [bacterium]|nr:helix-turn-helix transcriptional regulator [bacterium]
MNYKERTQEIALRVRKVRRTHGYSGKNLAGHLNLSRSSYYRLEGAKSRPSLTTLINLAHTLNISLDWLILNRGEMYYEGKTTPAVETKSTTDTLDLKELSDDIKELLEHIREIPLLRYEVLTTFYRFKEDRSAMVEREMKKK